jgi:hypothetical protein
LDIQDRHRDRPRGCGLGYATIANLVNEVAVSSSHFEARGSAHHNASKIAP